MPTVERSLRLVNPALLDVLYRLVSGRLDWPLLIHGNVGRGKTAAALALCDIMPTACYWTAETLGSFVLGHEPAEVENEFRVIGEKSLGILDELGARANAGDLGRSVVQRFADAREMQAGRVAVYISNLTPAELARVLDDRIVSRIACGTIFRLDGNDRRRQS
ncbi:MAG: hypothetical protein JNM18_00215 [Planctomycetaceae bacterium]|nr:hypothetical protein [Planctomycetaceae bacterium]